MRNIGRVVLVALGAAVGLWHQAASATTIPMEEAGGVFAVPVTINGVLPLSFQVDSGASVVVIPEDVAITLVRTRTVREEDFVGTRTYRLADGSTVPSSLLRIRSLKVGNVVVENVIAAVGNVRGGLLLGQTFLKRFKSWSIDNRTHALILNGPVSPPEALPPEEPEVQDPGDGGSNRLGSRNTGLTGRERARFVSGVIESCSERQRKISGNEDVSPSTIARFCTCYSNRVADNISSADIESLRSADVSRRRTLQARMDEAVRVCTLQARNQDGG